MTEDAVIPVASVLTGFLEVAGIWAASMTWHAGLASAMALVRGLPPEEIGRHAAVGAAAGWIVGVPLAICATILLLST